jgi:hypothetical protein
LISRNGYNFSRVVSIAMSGCGTKQTRDAAVKTEHLLRASRPRALKGARAFFCRQPGYPVKGEASEGCDATS